jgi:pilus assembly protein Flp/PilA
MTKLMEIFTRVQLALVRDRSGATAIEYGLLAAGISVIIIGTVFLLGDHLDQAFQGLSTEITGTGGE